MRSLIQIAIILLANLAIALNIPADFLYQDRPIDPNCILESNISHSINLKECSLHKGKKITSYSVSNEFIGYDYINLENNYPGSIIYKYLGIIKDMHVVHASAIGGAISRLDYINYFKINGDILKLVKRGPAGDRSFGGLSKVYIKDGILYYDIALTAKLFMTNFSHNQETNPNFEELGDCALCQFALVHYRDNKIQSVTLNSEIGNYRNNSIEICFNNIHHDFIKKKRLNLSEKEAKEFATSFLLKCLK